MRLHIFILNLIIFLLVVFSVTVFAENIIDKTLKEYRRLGVEAQERGDLNAALSNFNKAMGLGAQDVEVINDLAILYEEFGVDARSEQLYLEAIHIDRTYLPPYMNLAYLYLKHGNTEKAARYFRQRYEMASPNDPWGQKAVQELLKIKPGYKKWIVKVQAERLKKEIIEDEREKFSKKVAISRTHFFRGRKLHDKGEYHNAISEYNKALHVTPDNKKIKEARKEAVMELTRKDVVESSEQAIRLLEAGDIIAAKIKFREILSTIPNDSDF